MPRSAHLAAVIIAGALLISSLCSSTSAAIVADAIGDTFGSGAIQHDITSISALEIGNELVVTVDFAGPVSPFSPSNPASVVGFIAIDTNFDADMAGSLFFLRTNSPPAPGIDFYIDLHSQEFFPPNYNSVELLNSSLEVVGNPLAISYGPTSLTVSVPLLSLGISDDNVNIGALIGTFGSLDEPGEPTDQAPDVIAAVPEPGSLTIFGLGLAGLFTYRGMGRARWRQLRGRAI
jgi:hypothetical protein